MPAPLPYARADVAPLFASVSLMKKLTAALTPRERQIIELVVDGCSNSEIASRLKLSPQTVKNQLSVIFDKVGAASRVQLAVFAVRHHLIQDPTKSPAHL